MSAAIIVLVVFTSRAHAGFVVIPTPDATYLAETALLPITVVLSSTDDFAIAQVRGSVPEPGFVPKLIGLGVVGIPMLWFRSRRHRAWKEASP